MNLKSLDSCDTFGSHQAIKDISTSYDALIDLFESFESFLRRLDIYTKIPSTTAITEIIIKILIELLSTISLAIQQAKQGRLSEPHPLRYNALVTPCDAEKFGKKLFGENYVEAAMERLDRLTRDEAQTTATQTLELVYGLVRNIKIVLDGARGFLLVLRAALIVVCPSRGKSLNG